MKQLSGYGQHLALPLLILLLLSSCGQQPTLAVDTPSPEPIQLPSEAYPTPTTVSAATSTPMPRVNFMGVEFAFDEMLLGPLGAASHKPPIPKGETPTQPEHLEIWLQRQDDVSPVMYVIPVQQYEALSEVAAAQIVKLRDLLIERPREVIDDLPFLPMYQAVESYHSDPKYIDFSNGSGMSFLVKVDHDHSLATNEAIYYTFQGLTSDQKFYVATLVPITGVDNALDVSADLDDSRTTERMAKAAANNGNWISIDQGHGQSLIDDMMQSLHITPQANFPVIKLPDFATANGILLAYDKTISGNAAFERGPSLVENPDGSFTLLDGVPDMLTTSFSNAKLGEHAANLKVQPVRDEQGVFFTSIPAWQKDLVTALEQDAAITAVELLARQSISDVTAIASASGSGLRGIIKGTMTENDIASEEDSQDTYIYGGVTENGRYLVLFFHALPEAMSRQAALDYLDGVVSSLQISANASTDSSMPVNAVDCTNDAEFVADVSIPDYTEVERGDTFLKIWRVRNSGTCTWTPAYQIVYAQGNPLEWQPLALTEIVEPDGETEVSIAVQSPDYPSIYQAWWQLADEQEQKFGDMLQLVFEAPRPATDLSGYGVIEGQINYPANGNPAFEIYFHKTDGSEQYVMQTEQGWTRYSKAIPVGNYFVFARVLGDTSNSGGGYTEAVICGLHAGCEDHGLVEVVVEEGKASKDVNLFDWYAPAGSFPLPESLIDLN